MSTQPVQPSPAQGVAALAAGLAVAAYPFVAPAAVAHFGVRGVAAAVLAIGAATLAARVALDPGRVRVVVVVLEHAGALLLAGAALLTGDPLWLLLFPVLVNATLCAAFLGSLRHDPCIVEEVASWIEPYLPDFTRSYCRGITVLWSGFFALAALGIACVALLAPTWWRAATVPWYFGTLAVLSVAEFAFRKIWFRHYTGRLIDKPFARFFPADRTERGRRSLAYLDRMRELGLHQD
jgi:uncharacterized membrane protein